MTQVKFKVSGISESDARTSVQARGFKMIVDEPLVLGGDNQGPDPVEYLLAGFVGSISYAGHLVEREMGFKLRHMEVDAQGSLNPDGAFGKATRDRTGLQDIEILIRLDADADEETLSEWTRQVENRCPVLDNLRFDTPVVTTASCGNTSVIA